MSYVKIWVHIVWATKRRQRTLTAGVRRELISHIKHNARQKRIVLDCLNGHDDHLHALIRPQPEQSISKVVQLLKGESAHWANEQKTIPHKLEWAKGYFAISVSESGVKQIRAYIAKQEEHHQRKTFAQEYTEFIDRFGFVRIADEAGTPV
ncbi:IS200/IS605 family transposase [Fibrella sp. HMF5335]|uniref:IS200/IS605 family transposase n=1 Tax=Fibrella rubiginis TaxID=2817060 RepID=A0A939K8R4_9BACT|nr:IS200/IS605 family transposase [Fibrella rubiginis]MBO0940015.1 IS200/IS605 family transposase [Fibrella rubiginis]